MQSVSQLKIMTERRASTEVPGGAPTALPGLPALPVNWRRDCALIALLYLVSRVVVLIAFHFRGRAFPFMDSYGYMLQAKWLAAQGSLLIPDEAGGRFFHGMPLLVSLLGRATGEFVWTGLALNALMGVGAVLLFYRNVARLDWGVWHALLFPAWVATTSTLHSEAGQWFFCLLALTAFRLRVPDRMRRLMLMVAGYAVVCRPTAVFILVPMLGVSMMSPGRSWRKVVADAWAMAVFPLLMAAWALGETRQVFPEAVWQAKEFARWSRVYGGFPHTIFAWPGQSLIDGFGNGSVRPVLKVFTLLHLLAWTGGIVLAARAWLRDRSDGLAGLLTLELALNGLFILTVGGPFGHTMYYRFLATQMNVFLVWAWLRHGRIPSALWWVAGVASVALASLASAGG